MNEGDRPLGGASGGPIADGQAAHGTPDALEGVRLAVDAVAAIQYAMHVNDVGAVRAIRIENTGERAYRDLRLILSAEPAFASVREVRLDELRTGQVCRLEEPELPLDHGFLDRLTERVAGTLRVELWCGEERLALTEARLTVFARNEWFGDGVFPELLASFVLPNEPAVAKMLSSAGEFLARWTGSPSIDGYQRQDPNVALLQIGAVYAAIQSASVQYVNPPASFESNGQRIRLPGQVLEQRQATCLDLTLLATAMMEQAGLHPILVLVDGHAFCGAWLEDWSLPDATSEDPARLRNHLANGDLVVLDPTTAVAGSSSSLEESRRVAERYARDDAAFRVVIDVHRTRRGKIRPLPTLGSDLAAPIERSVPAKTNWALQGPDGGELVAAHERHRSSPREVERGPERIETWKRRLLDLTLRNRLLNIPKRGRFVNLFAQDVAALEDALADGTRFRIRHRPDELAEDTVVEGEARRRLSEEDLSSHLADEQQKGVLYADMEEGALDTRLTSLLREANTGEEEGGSSNLYLSVGLLKYFETEKSNRPRHAPVVLVPVALRRRTISEGVVLEPRAEEARINVTLLRYLEETHGVRVEGIDPPPDDGSGLDIPIIFRRFREEVLAKRGWEVLEEATIGMFSFSKILIWRDLDEYAQRLLESNVVRHLVETPRETFRDGVDFKDPRALDATTKSIDTFVPMPADSSQLSAILAAAEGKSFVLIGPPGTGKSQTITNLITHCLATGRSVLFVSEKMAALEVVHRRLTAVGLGEQCLELHSNKAKKKEVLDQLAASLQGHESASPLDRDAIARDLDEVRSRLNAYVEALHCERPSGETVFQVLSRLIGLAVAPKVELGWADVAQTPASKLQAARERVADVQAAAESAAVGPTHSLTGIGQTKFTPLWERETKTALEDAEGTLRTLDRTATTISETFLDGLPWPRWSEREALLSAVRSWSSPAQVEPFALTADAWGTVAAEVEETIEDVKRLAAERKHFAERYGRHREEIDVDPLLAEIAAIECSWFLPRFFGRRRWVGKFAAVTSPKQKVTRDAAVADLERLKARRERERTFEGRAASAARVFGESWEGPRSDAGSLGAALDWIRQVRDTAQILAGGDRDRGNALLRTWSQWLWGDGITAELVSAFAVLEEQWAAAASAAQAVERLLQVDDAEAWLDLEPRPCLRQAERWLGGWDGIRAWCRWRAERERGLEAGLEILLTELESGAVSLSELRIAFERSYGEEWYVHTISADECLADFESVDHERAITRFRDLDKELMKATRASVRGQVEGLRRSRESLRNGVQGGFLRRETQKQRRHRPIRTIFKEAGDLVRELRPCLLMSPLSVAQYLDPSLPRFDVVVFDEASQMPVWDAIGAVARGNQLIVVGDPKQLPPTNFFGKSDADAGEEAETEDLESVLDECIASNIEQHTLAWHYRSRHESLIAFSNRNYYDGELITFPAAVDHQLGVSWRPVPDGVYDFGKTRTNRSEAQAVVAEIVRRLQDPDLQRYTIGVVALSQAQQSLVLDLLDAARREHSEIERFFGDAVEEPVFVKNLENVQGDERDVILFTICYGPDVTGRVRMNFGPLNKEGGWRRLNVAITRARREVLVFSTLTHDQIDLNRSRSAGVHDLKRFLQFAELGEEAFKRELTVDLTADVDSPFEAEVAAALAERGWTVHRQVGCSGYRIDLAVVDPTHPGRYLLGIECDGASYHSAPSARDRDKIRQELLQDLGWRLHRIWSTDWWENREREITELVAAVDEALAFPVDMSMNVPAERSQLLDGPNSEPHEAPPADVQEAEEPTGVSPSDSGTETPRRYASQPSARPAALHRGGLKDEAPTTPAGRVQLVLDGLSCAPTSESEGLRLKRYRPTPSKLHGWQDCFYDDSETPKIARALREVIRIEAPILEHVAARRLGELWGFQRVKAKAAARVAGCVDLAGVHVGQTGGERVLWTSPEAEQSHRGARVPLESDVRTLRPIGDRSARGAGRDAPLLGAPGGSDEGARVVRARQPNPRVQESRSEDSDATRAGAAIGRREASRGDSRDCRPRGPRR